MKIINYLSIFILSIISVSLTSCDEVEEELIVSGDRTIICYMVAENSLADLIRNDINDIISCARKLGPNDRVVIYYDDLGCPKIYVVDRNTKSLSLNTMTPVFTSGEDYNSCSKETMQSFFQYVMINYPSKSYGLIFSSHGMSWLPPTSVVEANASSRMRSFGLDNGENTYSNIGEEMKIVDLAKSIKTLPHLDFIFFDLCYMQSIEVAYQLRDCADFILGSPSEIPGPGAPYSDVMPMLMAKDIDFTKIIDTYATKYIGWQKAQPECGVALSVINCEYLDSLKDVTNKMTAKYGDKIKECRYNGTTTYLDVYYSKLRYHVSFYDMREMMMNMMDEADFNEWLTVYDKTVPYYSTAPYIFTNSQSDNGIGDFVKTNPENCGGMAMSLFPSDTKLDYIISEYEGLDWRY